MSVVRALTLTQPWATLVAIGAKRFETRSWGTKYRGPLAIHAAKGLGPVGGAAGLDILCRTEPFLSVLREHFGTGTPLADALPFGAIVATCTLGDVLPTPTYGRPLPWINVDALSARERAFGDYSEGRYAWLLRDVRMLATPIPCRGALGLWDPPDAFRQWSRPS